MDDSRIPSSTVDRALVAHAAHMTLLGLLSGFTPALAKAPRAALSAHTIGVLQGALLFGLAAVWPALGSGRVVTAARHCALIGLYANWLGLSLLPSGAPGPCSPYMARRCLGERHRGWKPSWRFY